MTHPPAVPAGSRGSRLLGDPEQGRRGVIVSVISTLLVLAVIGYVIVNLPSWPRVQEAFFNADVARSTAPKIVAAFARNVARDAQSLAESRALLSAVELATRAGSRAIQPDSIPDMPGR